MRKLVIASLLATTMISGAAYATPSWDSAGAVRDSLQEVYDDLSGAVNDYGGSTTGWDSGKAGVQQYAELLYRIDNLGDDVHDHSANIIRLEMVTDDGARNGHIQAVGGATNRTMTYDGFTLQEVLDQVNTFVSAVNSDLFDTTDVASVDEMLELVEKPDHEANGLAALHLMNIIKEVNRANEIITNVAKTQAEKQAAIDAFYAFFNGDDGAAAVYNNAVDALVNISASTQAYAFTGNSVDGYTNETYTAQAANFVLGGDDLVYDHEATMRAVDGANIVEGDLTYSSYVDYTLNAPAGRTIDETFSNVEKTPVRILVEPGVTFKRKTATSVVLDKNGVEFSIENSVTGWRVVSNGSIMSSNHTSAQAAVDAVTALVSELRG